MIFAHVDRVKNIKNAIGNKRIKVIIDLIFGFLLAYQVLHYLFIERMVDPTPESPEIIIAGIIIWYSLRKFLAMGKK